MNDIEILNIASNALKIFCQGEITEDEAKKTIITVLKILSRIENETNIETN